MNYDKIRRMNKLRFIALPLLLISISACSTNNNSSNPSSGSSDTSESTPSGSSSQSSSSSSSSYVPILSERNPMNEPQVHNQYYLNHIGDIYNTWKSYQGDGITIAVIDKGFKYDHEDFVYENNQSKVSELSAAFTTTGTSTSIQVGRNKVSAGTNDNAHGTFCAGVAAAGINGKGVIGIAPLAELMLLKTDGHPLSINEAFRYAADNGAKVITISIGSYSDYDGDLTYNSQSRPNLTTVFNDAVNYCRNKNVAVISAAGNGGLYSDSSRRTQKTWPGATPGVIGAAGLAADKSNIAWSGSSLNPNNTSNAVFCDVFAPADGMYGCTDHRNDYNNYYKYDGGWMGTSFASPIVAGIAALYFEKNPNNTVAQFEEDLYASCAPMKASTGVSTSQLGHGRVDVGKLLGTSYKGNISIKIQNTGPLKAHIWNSITDVSETSWNNNPPLSKNGNYYNCTVNTNNFDSVIFHDDSTQTIEIYASSFIYNNVYNLDVDGGSPFIGRYIAN